MVLEICFLALCLARAEGFFLSHLATAAHGLPGHYPRRPWRVRVTREEILSTQPSHTLLALLRLWLHTTNRYGTPG